MNFILWLVSGAVIWAAFYGAAWIAINVFHLNPPSDDGWR